MKLTKELLTKGSDLWIYNPPVDFFIDKVENNVPFSFVKMNHGLYERILDLFGPDYVNYSQQEIADKYIPWEDSPRYRKSKSVEAFNIRNKKKRERQGKEFARGVNDFLDLLGSSNNLPPNFFLGVSDTGHGKSKGIDYVVPSQIKTPIKYMVELMKFYLPPKDYELYRGTVWKDYYLNNSLPSFLEAIKNKNVLYFGSNEAIKRGNLVFTKRREKGPIPTQDISAILNKFELIPISHTTACAEHDYIKKRISEVHDSIIFFCAGMAQVHVIKEMHLVNGNTLIDVGRALLPYLSKRNRWKRKK